MDMEKMDAYVRASTPSLLTWTTIIVIFSLYYAYFYTYWARRGVQYITPYPIIGNFLPVISTLVHPGKFFAQCYAKARGPLIGIYIMHKPYVILRDWDLIKHVLIKDFDHFHDRTIGAELAHHDVIGTQSLFIIKNPAWKAVRAKVVPFFATGSIRHIFPLLEHLGVELNNHLRELIDDAKGESIDVREACLRFATDTIVSCSFSLEANSLKHAQSPFREIGRTHFSTSIWRCFEVISYFFVPVFVKIFGLKLFRDHCAQFLAKMFAEQAEARRVRPLARPDFLDLLLKLENTDVNVGDDGKTFRIERSLLIGQIAAFFQAGFESGASGMSFLFYHLSLTPSIQTKLRAEIRRVLLEYDGKITYESIADMRYLNMCVSEALRMYPTLPFIDRMCKKTYKVPGTDIVIEKGTPIIVPILGVHFDPQRFPDPERFYPERYIENEDCMSAFLGFGNGPRKCIGERFGRIQIKIGVISVLSEFEILRAKDTEVPVKITSKAVVTCPTNGIKLILKPDKLLPEFVPRATNPVIS